MIKTLRKTMKWIGVSLFGLYGTGLLYFLFFAKGYGRTMDASMYDYNLRPFHEICRYLRYWKILGIHTVILNLAGNIIGFVPFGILIPLVLGKTRRMWKIAVLGLEVSVLIEVLQLLFRVGCFDVDDIILNTTGAVLGYLIFAAVYAIWYRMQMRVSQNPKR